MNKPRTIQEIFDIVIDNSLYPINKHNMYGSSNYMCIALKRAHRTNLITNTERDKASESILNYIAKIMNLTSYKKGLMKNGNLAVTLYSALVNSGYTPRNGRDLTNIYRNWQSRPYSYSMKQSRAARKSAKEGKSNV